MSRLFSDSQRREPYPLLARLRGASPVFHDAASNLRMLLRYDDVKRLAADHVLLSSAVSPPRSRAWKVV